MPQKPDLVKRELWRKRLRDFERGSTTIIEFCRRAGVAVWSFYYWRQRFQPGTSTAASDRQRHGTATPMRRGRGTVMPTRHGRGVRRAARAATKLRMKFVPIQITGQLRVEVHLPRGVRLTVPCQDHDAIAAVIAALVSNSAESRPC